MHIAINALPIQPGGGLTVLCGLVRSLRECRPSWQITVLTGCDATQQAIESLACASRVQRALENKSSAATFLWQCTRLEPLLRELDAAVVLAFNHYQPNVPCPQVVYHLNLRRFCRAYRSRLPLAVLQEGVRDWLAKTALRSADANVFESRYLCDAAEKSLGRPPHNPHVAYIGVPDSLLAMADQQSASPGNSRRIVSITSPEAHKDNSTLIRMLAKLVRKETREDWHLDIVGGINKNAWKPARRLAEDLGIRNRIKWHGFCDQSSITQLLKGALCMVATSQLESFAMVALEAMARGCSPIVADCAAMPESIGDAGLLATPGVPKSFAHSVHRLAAEPELRAQLVQRGFERVHNFRWSQCGITFAKLIEELPGNSREFRAIRAGRVRVQSSGTDAGTHAA